MFTIEDHFQITGRGLVIVGEKEDKSLELKIGTSIIIETPEGKEIQSKVDGLEMLNPPNFKSEAILIRDFTKNDLPIGSTVFVNE